MSKPTLCLKLKEITEFSGKAPCPRINASSCIIRNNKGEHLLVIHGGRNDEIFNGTKNVALNDVNLFNTVTKQWMQLAMYGQHPCSRWSHSMVAYKDSDFDGFIIFGGINLRSYCQSNLHMFNILNYDEQKDVEEVPEFSLNRENLEKQLKQPANNNLFGLS